MSSGLVSIRTKMTLRPSACSLAASSDENTISPDAAPGEAGSPVAITSRLAPGSMVGCSNLIERGRVDPRHRLFPGDQAFIGELDGDAQARLRGALAAAGLQHPQLGLLDREFHVLHVAIVLFEQRVDSASTP